MQTLTLAFLSSEQYIPHGHCYLWQTPLVSLHVVSNVLIAIAYFSIPIILLYFVRQRQDSPFIGVFKLFSAFILFCGLGHLLDVWTLWHPDYWISGIEHALTALISWITMLQLIIFIPRFLALKTPEQLEEINSALQQEIIERQHIELERNHAYAALEHRVQERTKELKLSQERLNRLIEYLPIGIVEWDFSGKIQKWNPASERIFGYSQEEIVGQHYQLIVFEEYYEQIEQITTSTLTQKGSSCSINENRTKSGETIICEWHNNPILDDDSSVLGAVSIVMDISDRKRLEAERQEARASLQRERECLRTILDNLTDGIVACDENGNIMLFNNAAREFHGLAEQAIPPDQWAEYFDLYMADGVTPMPTHEIPLYRAFQGEIVHDIEIVIAPKQGHARAVLSSGQAFFDENGVIAGAVVAMHDISDRKQAEAALQKAFQETEYQSRLLRTVIDSTEDLIYAKNQDLRYILVNQSCAKALNRSPEDILGKDDLELGFLEEHIFGDPVAGIRGFRHDDLLALTGEAVRNPSDHVTLADGSVHILDTSKVPLCNAEGRVFAVLGSSRDVTDRRRAEEALRRSEAALQEKAAELETALKTLRLTQAKMIQAEKMSSLGQLVAGIAHEINNPVNFIHGNLQPIGSYAQDLLDLLNLYQAELPKPSAEIVEFTEDIDLEFLKADLPKLLNSMKMGTERIREIVLSLRNFSRLDEADIKAVDLHEGIDNTLIILGNRLKANATRPAIQVVKQYSDLPLVECYAGQLNQVFMNIINNAIDALEERIKSEAQDLMIQELNQDPMMHQMSADRVSVPTIAISTQQTDANEVLIQITDNGSGIAPDVQLRLFDPFFTTKPVGKGTGMGLSISYQIVTETHQGVLQCISEPNQGATFSIKIPVQQSYPE